MDLIALFSKFYPSPDVSRKSDAFLQVSNHSQYGLQIVDDGPDKEDNRARRLICKGQQWPWHHSFTDMVYQKGVVGA